MSSKTLPSLSELTPQELQSLARMPAGAPPLGVTPNFNDPPTNIAPLYVVSSLLLGLSILFAVSRAYQKIKIIQKASIDDGTYFFDCSLKTLRADDSIATLLVGFVSQIKSAFLESRTNLQYQCS